MLQKVFGDGESLRASMASFRALMVSLKTYHFSGIWEVLKQLWHDFLYVATCARFYKQLVNKKTCVTSLCVCCNEC